MRSDGQVRFIKVSSRLQMSVAGAVLAAVLVWLVSMAVMGWAQYQTEADLASFERKKAQIATKEERIDAFQNNLGKVVDDLEARQDFLDSIQQMLPADVRDAGINVTDSTEETAEVVEKIGQLFPEARGLAEIEARQIAFVESMTHYADWRSRKAQSAMRKLNLDPNAVLRRVDRGAMGGPLEALSTSADGSLDPRFERLGLSLARMTAMEHALDGVPQFVPTPDGRVTSPFGFRRDPFTGRSAMHSGIDYGGPIGHPIFAAAKGTITFVGWKSGYGRTVDVAHGNGIMTRYAHLSRFDVKVGDAVEIGEVIAGLGNSGRSTGPHLHFEVRLNNRPVNPRPFLETAPDVLKEARGPAPVRTASAPR